jgi:ABC-type transport system involved in multi-copper enzyme maturation permease subunit
MYARLWWKDARQFWPIWVFLALAAAVVQGLFLYFLGQDARHGALGVSALTCASLYAFATGAAAFAGERETGTLRLLDILPVDRRVVWVGKVSFALVTTLALALVLLAMAAMATDHWRSGGSLSVWEAIGFGLIVFVALGWGLFWSAILSNALTAAVVAIFCTSMTMIVFLGRLDYIYLNGQNPISLAIWQLSVFLATLIASIVLFARSMRWKRIQLKFRSPVVVNLADSTSPRRVQLQIQSPVATVLTPRPAIGMHEAFATAQPPRRSLVVEARVLAWQTVKEGWKTWLLTVAIGLVLPVLFLLRWGYNTGGNYNPAYEWLLLTSAVVSLMAGTSVFGLENRSRTQRFLTHHGARPGLVCLVKLAVWGVGLAMIWGPLALTAVMTLNNVRIGSIENWLSGVFIIALYFGIAVLCGMAIRRGITAGVIALVAGLALTVPLIALVQVNMLPVQGLLAIPAGLLAVSWIWSGDWQLERPAPGRWVRLGLLLTGMFTVLVSWYAGYRAWSIPDVGPITPPAVWLEAAAASVPADQDAAELYREAGRRLVGPFKDSPEFLERNRELLDLLRRAAARPSCGFVKPQKPTLLEQLDLPPLSQLAYLLALDASERQSHGDLAGAWDDIVAMFHMAQHGKAGLVFAFPDLLSVERTALGHALEWAVAQGQTPERLHTALTTYLALPKIAPAADLVRAEANLIENTLDLPTSRLRDWVFETMIGNGRSERVFSTALVDLVTTSWERVRARRINRLISRAVIRDAMLEPWQRSRESDPEIDHAKKTSRNAMMLIRSPERYVVAFDHNEVARWALVQVLALRKWQLKHGGQFPKSLDALVPEELPNLPDDPYSGRPFGYRPSQGQEAPRLRDAPLPYGPIGGRSKGQAPSPGSWLLYSVGADGHDDGGISFKEKDPRYQPLDIVFAIPPVERDAGASNGQDRGQETAKDRPATVSQPAPVKPGF